MIDSCHRDRLMEAHSELAKLLTEKELRDALLLIFANKQVESGYQWGGVSCLTLCTWCSYPANTDHVVQLVS